ncbi:MAG: cysteine synthase A [Candidatus Aenigmarchaeota archaeon]|nr:cysteine synthase A [Candidatus Aenigmarchaeota archaeon]
MKGHARHIEHVLSGRKAAHREAFDDAVQAIGNIPMVEIRKLNPTKARIFAKLEFMNPSGSIKDRMVAHMLDRAEERGDIKPSRLRGKPTAAHIVEATSGNTGISFAMMCAARGYKFTAVMPDSMTGERIAMMKAFGAKVILTPAKQDMAGACRKAMQISAKTGAWHANQFANRDNTEVHKLTTGREIISQMHGNIDAFVAGVGTGGTLMGMAEALKERGIKARIVAVEPAESAVLSGGKAGIHNIQGIGEGFVPKLIDMKLIDDVVRVKTRDAEAMAVRLACEEGLLVGISSGANVLAAIQVARKMGRGRRIVTVLPDRGERYLSTGVFG